MPDTKKKIDKAFFEFSNQILYFAGKGILRIDFLKEISKMMIEFSECDSVELRIKENDRYYRSQYTKGSKYPFSFDVIPISQSKSGEILPCFRDDSALEKICSYVIEKKNDASPSYFTKQGSFWVNDAEKIALSGILKDKKPRGEEIYKAIAMIPIDFEAEKIGFLILKSKRKNVFTKNEIISYEKVAKNTAIALAHRRIQISLRERIKEITCLYEIARASAIPGILLDEIMQGIVELLPPAWLYPEIASAKIALDDNAYYSTDYKKGIHKQTSDIFVKDKKRGYIEVAYSEKRYELDEGPFLREERNLIDTIANQIGMIVERREAEQEKKKLKEQLIHADRLSTIGLLASGVAHELNEPIGNILGFAQLMENEDGLKSQIKEDIKKIVNSSLYMREIIKKLLLFARQMPTKKTHVNINNIVNESLSFFESRLKKTGIELVKDLSDDICEITADSAQLNQVVVNLVVNAFHAMQNGGILKIRTYNEGKKIVLSVEDSGIGIKKKIMQKIFLPFFTTKEINEGTGLGLSVVHGIVKAHNGEIKVFSEENKGSKFMVFLPVGSKKEIKEK